MTDDQIIAECESRFQAGSSRTQIINPEGQLARYADNRREGLWIAEPDERVFVRQKVRLERRYAWQCIKEAKT